MGSVQIRWVSFIVPSKGSKSDASTPWATYKDKKLDSTCQQNLIDTQKDIRKDIQR